jgi:nitronate monooxygenase
MLSTRFTDHGIWTAGQVQGVINDIPTCKELVERMISEAHEIIDGRLAGISQEAVA